MSEARARRIETSRHSESAAKVTAEAEAAAEAAAARVEAVAAAEEAGEEPEPEPEPVGPCQVSVVIKADVQARSLPSRCASPLLCRTWMWRARIRCGAQAAASHCRYVPGKAVMQL